MCPPGYAASLARSRDWWAAAPRCSGSCRLFGALARVVHVPDRPAMGGARAGLMAAILLRDQSRLPLSDRAADVGRAGRWNVGGGAGRWRSAVERAPSVRSLERSAAPRCSCGPNLAPLGLVMAGIVASRAIAAHNPSRATDDDVRRAGRAVARHANAAHSPSRATYVVSQLLALALGAFPFFVAVLALQNAMYGGPFSSGYGSFSQLFSLDHLGAESRALSLAGWSRPRHHSSSSRSRRRSQPQPRVATRLWGLLAFALTVSPATSRTGVRRVVVFEISAARVSGPIRPGVGGAMTAVGAPRACASAGRVRASSTPRSVAAVSASPKTAPSSNSATSSGASATAASTSRASFRRTRWCSRRSRAEACASTQAGRRSSGTCSIPAWLDRAVDALSAPRPAAITSSSSRRRIAASARDLNHTSRFGGLEWPPAALIGG